jgi:hypothetical protein
MVTDLGDQPTPEIEPAEPPPGGVDAVEDTLYEPAPLVPDLSRIGNEQGKDEIPDAVTEREQTDTEATRDGIEDHEQREQQQKESSG